MQLKMQLKTSEKTISSHFGMKGRRFDEIEKAMTLFFAESIIHEIADHEHDENGKCLKDQPKKGKPVEKTKVERLDDFMKSKQFAKLKWKPETANDFFLLGFMFIGANRNAERAIKEHIMDEIPDVIGEALGSLFGRMGKKVEIKVG